LENLKLILKIVATNLVLGVIVLAWIDEQSSITHTSTFCAYGNIFVEFQSGRSVWGTLMLDPRGNPIPCKEQSESKVPSKEQQLEYKGVNI
jgi:hypothetical protein